MSDEIAVINGKPAIAYFGETPWHGKGKALKGPATAEAAIKAAQLNWNVVKLPLYVAQGRGYRVKNRFAVVREDALVVEDAATVLGIVGADYTPLQNREAFRWFDPIVGEGAAVYHTAGALGDGERVWILAKLQGNIEVVGDDIAEKYLLLSNSHDGTSSVQVKFTPVRVVCQNTLTMALGRGRNIRAVHSQNLDANLKTARENLGIIRERFDAITADFQSMAKKEISAGRLRDYVEKVFPAPSNRDDKSAMNRVTQARAESIRLADEGKGNAKPGVRGTLWAAYNGVVEYIDFAQIYRDAESRLNAVWFGNAYHAKARAHRVAMDFAGRN